MSPRRRSFSFILIFISLNNGPALCQTVGPGIPQSSVPLPKESVPFGSSKSQLLNTLLTIASANGVLPKVLPAIQRIFPESQNIVTNEGVPQPLCGNPQEVPNGLPCQQCFTPNLSVNPNSLPPSQSNLGIINPYPAAPNVFVNEGIPADISNVRSCTQCFSPNLVLTNPYQIPQSNFMVPNAPSYPILPPTGIPYPITSFVPSPPTFAPPQAPPTIPPFPITDQNYNCFGPVPIIGLSGPQTVKQCNIFTPNCNLQPEIIQPQFNLQIPQMLPPAVPIRAPVLPAPSISIPLQNIGSWPYLPEPNAIPISTPIEIPVTNVVTTDTAAGCGQQFPLPISLQINMPAPVTPEPIIAVISTASPAPDYSSSFNIPSMMPPIHVVEKSRSRWKSWLPIILLALLDGGCGNNCGGGYSGCQCGSNIPIPYPIPIPTNNPIVMGCLSDDY